MSYNVDIQSPTIQGPQSGDVAAFSDYLGGGSSNAPCDQKYVCVN